MNIQPGTHLGRYEIRSLIGEGGMGQVYRATDTALARDVAIKVLPADFSTNGDRLRRFEQEARAAGALNHPNILAIHDIGSHDHAPYVVSEFLEGETLRDRLRSGPLSTQKALDYARQLARGLAAAHDKGIVHRDIKPENLFLTRDGHLKILDFGLAKLTNSLGQVGEQSEVSTVHLNTEPGVMLGTAGYMSPEQVRCLPADNRADIFSFGAVFYEMITGKRAFRGDSAVETMSAILKDDPQPLAETNRNIAPGIERIVGHCLEKRSEDRFQSTRDLLFDLESLSSFSDSTVQTLASVALTPSKPRTHLWLAVVGLAVATVMVAAYLLTRTTPAALPAYTQLTFRRGTIYGARFAPDGHTIVLSAAWNSNPIETFTMRAESPETRSLGLGKSQVLAVSSAGEMAILLTKRYRFHSIYHGTLARVPLTGGTPREMLENVQQATWSPDGSNLAVVRFDLTHNRLEYPVGKVLFETDGYISNPRVSPNGDLVAFMDHPVHGDNRGSVVVVDASGKRRALSGEWSGEEGLAWSPSGDEVWFTATKAGEAKALYAVTLSGKERVVARGPVSLTLTDISKDGDVLLTGDNASTPITGLVRGETTERDLSWLNWVSVNDLSDDGNTFIFTEFGQGSGANYATYLRKLDDPTAIRLGEGFGFDLSPDGKWVTAILFSPPQIVLLPTGAGQIKRLERSFIDQYGYGATWLPDGKGIVFIGKEAGRPERSYLQRIDGGAPRAVTPEGIKGTQISPDGKFLIAGTREEKDPAIYPLDGGEPRLIPGIGAEDRVIRWGPDSRSLYVSDPTGLPLKVFKLDVATGRREPLREIMPADSAGIRGQISVLLTPDGKGYVYAFSRYLNDLYLVKGLK